MIEFPQYLVAYGQLLAALKATGITYQCVGYRLASTGEAPAFSAGGGDYMLVITHAPDTRPLQRQQLDAIVSVFKLEKRIPKQRVGLREALEGLSPKDFKDLLVELLVEKLETDAGFAKRLGKAIDGDEAALTGKEGQKG